MKAKGNTKRLIKTNFWEGYEEKVPKELKEMIFEQYLSNDTLFIYCDASGKLHCQEMSVACSYVQGASVIVKQKFVYLPTDCINKNIYGEMQSIFFTLIHFTKYMMPGCKSVIIFSDVNEIENILNNQKKFENLSLRKAQSELILLYHKAKKQNPNISIEIKYLPTEQKLYNPFYRASHNAAYDMLHRR
ncbi:hypothetical protein [Neobacillus sp. D3-1R]|uniref:hypothetical protein n=1 Tax=Neobacillus sp. D3-1R TaxID=3445778 RepID=UPI003F9FFBBB